MSADPTPSAHPPRSDLRATRSRGLAAAHAVIAAAVAVSVVSVMAWVTSGRTDTLWPIRHLLEARVWQFAGAFVPAPDGDDRPPGAIIGKVTWRVTDAATPTPSPLLIALTPTPPSRGGAVAPTPSLAPTVELSPSSAPRARDIPVPGALVMVVDADGNAVEARTDAAGEYSLGGLYPGRYRVVAAAPGFAPVVVDRLPDASLVGQVTAWVRPGIVVPPNSAATVPIRIDRPSPPPLGAFARDVEAPSALIPPDAYDVVACGDRGENDKSTLRMAQRLPVALTGALADAPVASLRRYAPLSKARDRVGPESGPRERRAAVVAVVPVGSEEDACAAISLASRGVEVLVAGIAPDGRAERQVLATRTLLAALRSDTTPPSARGPVVVGTGFATAIVMRAVADEAADVPMDWAGVSLAGRAPPGSVAADRIEQRRATVASRVGGIVLVAPVLDLFAVRREASKLGLPGWLAEAVTALGPADREVARYVRFSARFAADIALPPVVVVRGGRKTVPLDGAIDDWARMLGSAGVSVEVMALGEEAPSADASADHEGAASAVVDRVAAMAGAP